MNNEQLIQNEVLYYINIMRWKETLWINIYRWWWWCWWWWRQ